MVARTKIVCTIGPSINSMDKIEAMIKAGMNVARLNFSHGTYEEHAETIHLLKEAREKLAVPLALMLDTKGPEIRLGKLKEGAIHVKEGQKLWFVKEQVLGDEEKITLTPPLVFDVLKKEMVVLLDNGYIITHIIEVQEKGVRVEVDHGGVIRSTKGVNIPGVDVELPALTAKDVEDIRFGCAHDIDLIAASFVRSAEHVMKIKKILEDEGKPTIEVFAKIENRKGVENFDAIVEAADGIMVARGDLGVEMPLAQVPRLQKMMIRKCLSAGKPSVTATQMLESMITNPRPTRAEASDVANAIYDSTTAVMLSGETAVGNYPIETVKVMKEIIHESEDDFDYFDFLNHITRQRGFEGVSSALAQASIRTAYSANAKAIFAFTTSGMTARLLSRYRPEMPIIAMTPNPKVYHQLSLCWGVTPLLREEPLTIEEAYKQISLFAMEKGYVRYGDLIVIIAGRPFGRPGTTNMLIVDNIGDVLVRGSGEGEKVHGKVLCVPSFDTQREYAARGKILLLTRCDENYLPLLKHAAGVILENIHEDLESESYVKQMGHILKLPFLINAIGATAVLREEQLVTLDPTHGIVYKGIV